MTQPDSNEPTDGQEISSAASPLGGSIGTLGIIGAGALAHNMAAAWSALRWGQQSSRSHAAVPHEAADTDAPTHVWARHASAGLALRDRVQRAMSAAMVPAPGVSEVTMEGAASQATGQPTLPASVHLLDGIDECCGLNTIVLAVRDSDLEAAAQELAAHPSEVRGAVVFHASGALPVEVLEPLQAAGYAIGRMHPLVSLRRIANPKAFHGVGFAIAGDDFVRGRAREFAEAVGGWILPDLPSGEAAVQYHAAAALLAGGMGVLFEHSLDGMTRALGDRDSARRGLIQLLTSVTANLAEVEPRDALTGPAARGDVEVVRSHLKVLTQEGADLYRSLLPTMLKLAHARGTLGADELKRMLAFLAQEGVR